MSALAGFQAIDCCKTSVVAHAMLLFTLLEHRLLALACRQDCPPFKTFRRVNGGLPMTAWGATKEDAI